MDAANDSIASGGNLMSRLVANEIKIYSQQHELSKPYPFVGVRYLVLSQVFYLALVLWGWRRQAADAKPLFADGKWAMRIYNAVQVTLSAYMGYLATVTYGRRVVQEGYVCQSAFPDVSEDPAEYELEAFTIWLFYLSKWLDFIDTIFIIGRSKWRQLSFLHTFHHSSMFIYTWTAMYFVPCGYFLIAPQFNAYVHMVMYFYYLLASFPALTPYLWWKSIITTIQLLQFVTGNFSGIYCFWSTARGDIEGISLIFTFMFTGYGILMFSMFFAFYRKTYTKVVSKKDT
jgi:hypothetical protein